MNDLVPYPDNARPGRSTSIYDGSTAGCPAGHARLVRLAIGLLGGFVASGDGEAVPDSRLAAEKARELVKLLALAPGTACIASS